jgi:hypothetical protein
LEQLLTEQLTSDQKEKLFKREKELADKFLQEERKEKKKRY